MEKNMKNSRKTQYTEHLIQQTYLQLLEEKRYSELTVKRICELADINRGTFYLLYEDLPALQRYLEDKTADELIHSIPNLTMQTTLNDAFITEYIRQILSYVMQNRHTRTILFNPYSTNHGFQRLLETGRSHALERWTRSGLSREDSEWLYAFTASGMQAVAARLLEEDRTPSEISAVYETIANFIAHGLMG